MHKRPPTPVPEWSWRWGQLARAVGVDPDERLLVALSGGADSVLLLHLLSAALPRPVFRAVHVDHNLRGEEGRADARFCANLCRALGVPFTATAIEIAARGSSLEARAREGRYRALIEEALRTGHHTLITGHHSDDALETLLMRWIRGTDLPGLAGLRARTSLDPARAFGGAEPPASTNPASIALVRPLIGMRRAEVRRLLSDRGLIWREDRSNADVRFTRSRVRHGLVPTLRRIGGEGAIENLRAFGRAVEDLEEHLAGATAHIAWSPVPYAVASRGPADAELGGVVERAELMRVATTLRRRILWRLLVEGTGRAPGGRLLARIVADLGVGRCTRHSLPGRWTLVLRSRELHLLPPRPARPPLEVGAARGGLPFPDPPDGPAPCHPLTVPGIATLPDGRRISAEVLRPATGTPVRRGPHAVELDFDRLPTPLSIRFPRPGDRFQPLGAPGSKGLLRFLADCGIPREERAQVALVAAGPEIVWVVGVRPAEACRVRPTTTARLLLTLHGVPLPRTTPAHALV